MGTVRRQRSLNPCCRLCRRGALRLQGLKPDSKVRRRRQLQAGRRKKLTPKKPEATAKAAPAPAKPKPKSAPAPAQAKAVPPPAPAPAPAQTKAVPPPQPQPVPA